MRLLPQSDGTSSLGDLLNQQLQDPDWQEFRAAVAFAKQGGIAYLATALAAFASSRSVRMSVGVDLRGTSKEGLQALLEAVTAHGGEVWVFHNSDPRRPTFHPKLYLFKKPDLALVIVGSGNLTVGGLYSNYEANIALKLDPNDPTDAALLAQVEASLDAWINPANGLALILSEDLIDTLERRGFIVPESQSRGDEVSPPGVPPPAPEPPLFGRVSPPAPPRRPRRVVPPGAGAGAAGGRRRGFLMTLQRTDAGTGQTTAGSARRSPEIFIPLAARDEHPDFWGWQNRFTEDPGRAGKWDRKGVRMRIAGSVESVNMMTWPVKADFRLRSEALRSAGRVGDILRIEAAPRGAGFDYYVEIIPQGTTEYARRLAQCVHAVRNSQKRYGYY